MPCGISQGNHYELADWQAAGCAGNLLVGVYGPAGGGGEHATISHWAVSVHSSPFGIYSQSEQYVLRLWLIHLPSVLALASQLQHAGSRHLGSAIWSTHVGDAKKDTCWSCRALHKPTPMQQWSDCSQTLLHKPHLLTLSHFKVYTKGVWQLHHKAIDAPGSSALAKVQDELLGVPCQGPQLAMSCF